MKRNECLVCSSKRLTKILDLGNHPFADTFVPKERENDGLHVYNLSCNRCDKCGHIQTTSITNPADRYSLFDYSYTSSNSLTSRNHWLSYASEVVEKTDLNPGHFVLDVGSNDGFLLRCFRQHTIDGLGIDPSPYMASLADEDGVSTIIDIFNSKVSNQIVKRYGKANVVVANNVFNHSEDPVDFAKAAYNVLLDNGHFVFELPYWKISVESGKIDQVYHEHVSYFTATSSKNIMDAAGFTITSIEVVDYHGGSLRVYASKDKDAKQCKNLEPMMKKESQLFKKYTYTKLMKQMSNKKFDLLKQIYDIKNNGGSIIAIGAAAKGNTLLNYLNLDHSIVDWVTDTSEHKCGKRTPLSNIPICNDDVVSEYKEVYALILSWNLSDKIKDKLLRMNSEIKFLNFYE
jgi:SAM-dependent methyltransferase